MENDERLQLPGAKIITATGCGTQKPTDLRGGRRRTTASCAVDSCRKTVPRIRKCIPEAASLNVRAYLDEVFGSLMSRLAVPSANGFGTGEPSVFEYVGTVVDSILRYNNIHFRTITVTVLKDFDAHMPEPLWYAFPNINDANSGTGGCSVSCGDELQIFVSFPWYREYSAVNTNVPVLWPNGALVVEKYNLPEEDRRVSVMDETKVKCIVACDHLAQHIINEYSLRSEDGSSELQQVHNLTDLDGDIHDRWTKTGATLHSFLDLTVLLDRHDQTDRELKTHGDVVWQSYGL